MNRKMIRTVAIAASAFALLCTAASAHDAMTHVWDNGRSGVELKMGEFKLLLNPELFKDGRAEGFRAAWRRVAEVAGNLGWKTDVDVKLPEMKEDVRVYTYPDTADGALHAKFYTLRQRIPVKADGTIDAAKADLTLKYSAKDGGKVPVEAYMKDMPKGTKAKAEVNVYGYVNKEAGKNVENATFQVTLKKQPVMNGTETIAWVAQKYPVAATLGIPADTVVKMDPSKFIVSYAIDIGEVKRGGTTLEVEACAWYNKDSGKLVTAEVSWRGALKDCKDIYEIFNAIQEKAPEILDAGRSKNACIQ